MSIRIRTTAIRYIYIIYIKALRTTSGSGAYIRGPETRVKRAVASAHERVDFVGLREKERRQVSADRVERFETETARSGYNQRLIGSARQFIPNHKCSFCYYIVYNNNNSCFPSNSAITRGTE